MPSTVNVWGASPLFSSVIVAPESADRQSGRNAKSASSTDVAGAGIRARLWRSVVASAGGEEHDEGEHERGDDLHGAGAYRPEPSERTGPRDDRVGYHRCMAQAAQIEPSRPLPIAAGDAVRMSVRTTAVDAVGLEERAASLAKRSIKRDAKLWALDLAIRSMDLTTLEGSDTVGKIVAICAKAVRPNPLDHSIPPVAAVCLYPQLVPVALEQLEGTGVKVASVAGGFPSGLGPLDARLQEIRDVAETGAHEIDIVLNRSLFLGGRYAQAFEELVAAREAAGSAHLKVILETGELGSYDRVRQASMLAMAAGADFIKTSTGKIGTNATLPVALCMLEAARDFHRETGRAIGIKVAGGVRTSKQAIQYLVLVHETLGADWMTPDRFRIGASSLLNDVLMQIEKERTGRYAGPDYFTID